MKPNYGSPDTLAFVSTADRRIPGPVRQLQAVANRSAGIVDRSRSVLLRPRTVKKAPLQESCRGAPRCRTPRPPGAEIIATHCGYCLLCSETPRWPRKGTFYQLPAVQRFSRLSDPGHTLCSLQARRAHDVRVTKSPRNRPRFPAPDQQRPGSRTLRRRQSRGCFRRNQRRISARSEVSCRQAPSPTLPERA